MLIGIKSSVTSQISSWLDLFNHHNFQGTLYYTKLRWVSSIWSGKPIDIIYIRLIYTIIGFTKLTQHSHGHSRMKINLLSSIKFTALRATLDFVGMNVKQGFEYDIDGETFYDITFFTNHSSSLCSRYSRKADIYHTAQRTVTNSASSHNRTNIGKYVINMTETEYLSVGRKIL